VATTTDPRGAEEPRHPAQEDLARLRAFLERHGARLVILGGLVLVAILAPMVFRGLKQRNERAAQRALISARSVPDLETLIARYRRAPATAVALLQLAKTYYDAGQFEPARGQYEEFMRRFPEHELIGVAELGIVQCREGLGQIEEARAGFAEFRRRRPGHFLNPEAMFGEARCLKALGRVAEARAVVEDFIAAHPDSGWVPKAESELADLKREPAAPLTGPADGAADWWSSFDLDAAATNRTE